MHGVMNTINIHNLETPYMVFALIVGLITIILLYTMWRGKVHNGEKNNE